MPGFNHYADCACGWCVNYGRGRLDTTQVRNALRQRDALTFLRRNAVNSISGCFINPNARCPVCSVPVFFYANSYGSRVYFDDLGPPWPKHPCTDNPRKKFESHPRPDHAPSRRPRGLMRELLTSAQTAGLYHRRIVGGRDKNEWYLLVITSIVRNNEENRVEAEFLEDRDTIAFKCSSPTPIFQVGDFISKKGRDISFLHQETLATVFFTIGSAVVIPRKQNAAPPKPASTRAVPKPVPVPQAVPNASHLTKDQIAQRLEGFGRVIRSRKSK